MPKALKFGELSLSTDAFIFALRWWLFLFLTIMLPLDLLYRYGSLLEGMSWLQLFLDFSSLVVFFSCVSLVIASVSLLVALPLNLCWRYGAASVQFVNAILGLLFLIFTCIYYFVEWLSRLSIFLPSYLLGLEIVLISLLGVLLHVYVKRLSSLEQIASVSSGFFKINVVGLVICALAAGVNLSYHWSGRIWGEHSGRVARKSDRPSVPYPNIIMITFDALAANHTSLHGYSRDTTPNLREFARKSYVANHMYASCNWTVPSVSSLLTGKHPIHHQMQSLDYSGFQGESRYENLPSLLKDLGYTTGAVVSNPVAIPWKLNLNGFDVSKGWCGIPNPYAYFEVWDHEHCTVIPSKSLTGVMKFLYASGFRSGPWLMHILYEGIPFFAVNELVTRLRSCIGYQDKNDMAEEFSPEFTFAKAEEFVRHCGKPFFLWVHVWTPHSPYLPKNGFLYTFLPEKVLDSKENYRETFSEFPSSYSAESQGWVDKLALRYDEYVRYADHELGNFLSYLGQAGVLDNSLVVITADHGEMFERGFWKHAGPYLYQPLINIPLVIHLPGQNQTKRLEANVSQVDLAPTILDFLGVTPPRWIDGKSIRRALDEPDFDTGAKFSMNLSLLNDPPIFMSKSIAVIKGDFKLIDYLQFQKYELYNLKADPGERVDLAPRQPEIFLGLKKELDAFLVHQF